MNYLKLFFPVLAFFLLSVLKAQDVPGCTDPQANNYDPEATVNDGSCTYDPTIYNPPFLYMLPGAVEENSGLIFSDGHLWTINDSGNAPVLYKMDTITGSIVQEITVADAMNIDWEALAQDEDHIFIGDFGNNSGNREDLLIYMVSKTDLPDAGNGTVSSQQIAFSYPDYPKKVRRKNHNFDCEAMICVGDSIYLFSKNRGDYQTKLYRLPATPGEYVAELLHTYDVAGLVTGADYNAAANEAVLIGYTDNNFIPFLWLLFDYQGNEFFSGNKRRIDMLGIAATQTEAITYMLGKRGVITSEGTLLFTQSAYNFDTGSWTDDTVTGIGVREARGFDFTLIPNPVEKEMVTVYFQQLPRGDYRISLYDSFGKLLQIRDYSIETQKRSVKIKLKVGNLAKGMYFVRITSVNTTVEKKFIKQ